MSELQRIGYVEHNKIFSAPRFTVPRRACIVGVVQQASSSKAALHPRPCERARPCLPGFVVESTIAAVRMLVRVTVHPLGCLYRIPTSRDVIGTPWDAGASERQEPQGFTLKPHDTFATWKTPV